jgi:hypothetical protein
MKQRFHYLWMKQSHLYIRVLIKLFCYLNQVISSFVPAESRFKYMPTWFSLNNYLLQKNLRNVNMIVRHLLWLSDSLFTLYHETQLWEHSPSAELSVRISVVSISYLATHVIYALYRLIIVADIIYNILLRDAYCMQTYITKISWMIRLWDCKTTFNIGR